MRSVATAVMLILLAGLWPPATFAREGQNVPPFERPLRTKRVHTGKQEIRCHSFAHVMVKEIDAGEVGDAQISLLPIVSSTDRPACQANNAANEHVIPSDSWSGYFLGAKDDYVVLSAEDGVNGGLGFSVYRGVDPASLFQDAVKFEHDRVRFQSIAGDAAGTQAALYTRLYGSLFGADRGRCLLGAHRRRDASAARDGPGLRRGLSAREAGTCVGTMRDCPPQDCRVHQAGDRRHEGRRRVTERDRLRRGRDGSSHHRRRYSRQAVPVACWPAD